MKKQKSLLRRIVTGAALCAMLTGVMLGQASTVKAEPVYKYNSAVTSVGVSGIEEPEIANRRGDSWRGSYVYYGGHLFRVLAPDTTDFSADDGILPTKHTMLLDSDSVLGEVLGEHIHFDNDGNPNQGAERANEWEYSDLKAWLNDQNNGFLKQFSKAEIQGIASSTKPDPVDGDGKGFPNVRYAPLKDDHVFVLDAVEASREDYGYYPTTGNVEDDTDAYSRVKTSVDDSYDLFRRSGIWWLRSPIYNPKYPQYAGFVFGANSNYLADGGYFTTNNVKYSGPGPSPALNVDLDSVLLSTCVISGGQYNNKYKLTLIYDGLETAITPGEKISINDSTMTVPFTVTDKDQNDGIEADCISVLVVRGDRTSGAITKYEQLTSPLIFNSDRTASGTVSFSLPSGYNSSSDHIYIFAENTHNSDSDTDYASAPLALMQPVAESGLVYDGSSHSLLNDDMGTIPSGFTAVYALSDGEPAEGSYSPEIPTARDAGVHRIWYKIKDNDTTVFGPLSMTVTIAKRRVGVSGITAAEKEYDGERNVTLSGGALNSSDIISGDDISIASLEGRFKYADAGDNKPVTVTKITLGGTSKDNYAAYPVQNSLTGKVTQKPVKVTGITANNKEYDGTKTATIRTKTTAAGVIGDAQIDGIVANDAFSILNLTVSKKSGGQFQNAAAENNKTVNLDIKLGGYCSANYTVSADSQTTATANITARNITIKANNQSVGVGGTIESSVNNVSIVAGSLVDGHSISAVTLTSSTTDTITDAGTITLGDIAIIDADGNIVTNNYNITKQNGVLTVTHEIVGKVTAAPAASAITYGQTLASSNLTGGTANVAGTFAWADNTIAPAVSDSNTTEYDVIFTPSDTGRYQKLTCKVKVTVTPKSITGATVALNKTQLEYNSSVQSVSVTGVTIDGLTLSENDYDVTGNTGTNVTNYTVTVTGKGKFKDTATAEWKIVEAGMTLSAPDVSATYDGQPHGIAVTVSEPAGAVIKFKDEAGAYTLDASPIITNAGKLVVGYQITADNYTPVTGSATVTVWPKAATVTALEQTIKEGESIQTGTGFATLTDAISGHTLSAVTLTAENGKIVPSAAKIQDAKGNDVTGNYAVTYTPATLTTLGKISRTVTFKVVNGSWDDGSAETKTVTLTGFAGDTLKLAAADIPAVGTKPGDAFKAGAWDVTPSADAEITADKTYTYTYALRDAYLVTVTNDGNGTGSASPNTGYEGTEVTLTAYPAQGYKFKEWQVVSGGVTVTNNRFIIGAANVEVKAVFEAQATGWHKGEAQIQPGAPEIQCSNMQEVVESIIAAIQKGEMEGISEEVRQAVSQPDAQVLVLFISAPLSPDQIPAENWAALEQLQKDAGYTGIVPFDITLMLNVNGQDVAEVHETKIPVKFSVGIMENLLGTPRQFTLVNAHNGAAKVIPTTRRGNFLDGQSTEFSTYAIAYKDGGTSTDTPAPTSTPAPVIDPTKFDDVAVPSDSFTFKKVWEGDSEKSIDFTLYRQSGTVYHHGFDKKVVSDKEWQYDAWFSAPAACYVIEKPIPGYQTKYVNVGVYEHITDRCCDGGTIINKKIPKTGDSAPLALWAGMVALGAVGLTTALVIGKKRKARK